MKELNKNNPFKTPEDYFDDFDARLNEKLFGQKAELPKQEGFEIPEGYFETVQDEIIKKITTSETKVIQLNPIKKYYYAAASIAATVLLIIGFNWNSNEDLTFETLAESDIESYFEFNEYDLSAYEIAEVIPVNELEINDILTYRFEEEHVVDYLDENIEDFDELNLEDYE